MSYTVLNGEVMDYDFDNGYWIVCCDCGLTHYAIKHHRDKKSCSERVYRDDGYTNNVRKKKSTEDIKELIKTLQRELRRRKK